MTLPRGASPIASNRLSLPLILASESARRLALLAQVGIVPAKIQPANVDETLQPGELPRVHAMRLARAKAVANVDKLGRSVILAADTVVACGRRILPKAASGEDVRRCLQLLSGRSHMVMTAVAAHVPDEKLRVLISETRVTFKRLTDEEIVHYVSTGEGLGKAGGYAIQGLAETFVRRINGSYSNVVGLPLRETIGLLKTCGIAIP